MSLNADDFLTLFIPAISTGKALEALHCQVITKQDRIGILDNQYGIWADDEIAFFLRDVCEKGPKDQGLVWWDPIRLTHAVNTGDFTLLSECAAALPSVATVVSAVVVEKHWHPLIWRLDDSGLYAYTCGLLHAYSLAHQALHRAVCQVLGLTPSQVQNRTLPFVVNNHCGAMVIAFVQHAIFGIPLPSSAEDLKAMHDLFRKAFAYQMPEVVPRPWVWGKGDAWKGRLGAILQEHGVANKDIDDRIQYLIDKLGLKEIEKVMGSPQPWRELKWAANQKVPIVQVIRPSELQAVLDQKIKEGKQIGSRQQKVKTKGAGKGKGKVMELDPLKLRLEKGVFNCGSNNTPLSQLELSQVGATANGIVLCTANMAAPYLRAGRQISAGALALIVISSAESIPVTNLISEKVRIPVLCSLNSEPLLVEGHLFQLGAYPVHRHVQDERFKLVSISSSVVKMTVYKDEVDVPWADFAQHPLRHIFTRVPILRACNDEECGGGCENWHFTEHCNVKEPVLEVWGRQWMQDNFTSCAPEKAQIFAVSLRVPQPIQLQVQAYSGIAGVYAEPKSIDGRGPSDQFQVIWMPRTALSELVLLKQTQPVVCGLARVGNRHGLRCKVEHAPTLHQAVKPGSAFLPSGRKQLYMVGPVPYGTLKESLGKALAESGWTCRPIQAVPTSKHIDGINWRVQAIEAPPTSILQLDHGEVVISRLDEQQVVHAHNPVVFGNDRTVQLCSHGATTVDPLQLNDPWLSTKGTLPIHPSGLKGQDDPLVALETRVIETVLAKIPAKPASMEVDEGSNGRLDVIERRVQELTDGQFHLHAMFQEQSTAQGSQINDLKSQANRLEVAVSDQNTQIGLFQNQFRAQLEQQQGQLDSLFQQQMSRIEEILKKPRHE